MYTKLVEIINSFMELEFNVKVELTSISVNRASPIYCLGSNSITAYNGVETCVFNLRVKRGSLSLEWEDLCHRMWTLSKSALHTTKLVQDLDDNSETTIELVSSNILHLMHVLENYSWNKYSREFDEAVDKTLLEL